MLFHTRGIFSHPPENTSSSQAQDTFFLYFSALSCRFSCPVVGRTPFSSFLVPSLSPILITHDKTQRICLRKIELFLRQDLIDGDSIGKLRVMAAAVLRTWAGKD